MPFKSKAQARYFRWAESKGQLPKGTSHEWAEHTPDIKQLPDHVSPRDQQKASQTQLLPNHRKDAPMPMLFPAQVKQAAVAYIDYLSRQLPIGVKLAAHARFIKLAEAVEQHGNFPAAIAKVYPEYSPYQQAWLAIKLGRGLITKRNELLAKQAAPPMGQSAMGQMPQVGANMAVDPAKIQHAKDFAQGQQFLRGNKMQSPMPAPGAQPPSSSIPGLPQGQVQHALNFAQHQPGPGSSRFGRPLDLPPAIKTAPTPSLAGG